MSNVCKTCGRPVDELPRGENDCATCAITGVCKIVLGLWQTRMQRNPRRPPSPKLMAQYFEVALDVLLADARDAREGIRSLYRREGAA